MCRVPDTGLAGDHGYPVYFAPGLDLPLYRECKIALPSYSEICNQFEFFKPDIVHLATEFSMGLIGLKYASSAGIPVVSSYTINFPQYLSYYKLGLFSTWAWKYLRWFTVPPGLPCNCWRKKGIQNLAIWGRGIHHHNGVTTVNGYLYVLTYRNLRPVHNWISIKPPKAKPLQD